MDSSELPHIAGNPIPTLLIEDQPLSNTLPPSSTCLWIPGVSFGREREDYLLLFSQACFPTDLWDRDVEKWTRSGVVRSNVPLAIGPSRRIECQQLRRCKTLHPQSIKCLLNNRTLLQSHSMWIGRPEGEKYQPTGVFGISGSPFPPTPRKGNGRRKTSTVLAELSVRGG